MHTNPEVLALLALGEQSAASRSDREHIAGCEVCSAEVDELAHLAGRRPLGRRPGADRDAEPGGVAADRHRAGPQGVRAGIVGTGSADRSACLGSDAASAGRRDASRRPADPRPGRGRRDFALAVAAGARLIVGVERHRRERRTPANRRRPGRAGGPAGLGRRLRSGDVGARPAGNQVLVVTVSNARDGRRQPGGLADRPDVKGMENIGPLTEPSAARSSCPRTWT